MRELVRYCVVVSLKPDSTLDRIRSDVPRIIAYLEVASVKHEMAFRSPDGLTFGWFIMTDRPSRDIIGSIKSSTNFVSGDSIMMFDIGERLEGSGFSRAWTWLQRTAKDVRSGGA